MARCRGRGPRGSLTTSAARCDPGGLCTSQEIGRRVMHGPANDGIPRVLRFDCGGCGGCRLESANWLPALLDAERLRLVRSSAPDMADILLVTGSVLRHDIPRLRRLYRRMGHAPVVLAVGACSLSGGVFRGTYGTAGAVSEVIPVDVLVPGCPPRAGAVLDGLFACLRQLSRDATLAEPLLEMLA
jgi:ech hydrogenase subunit C